MSKVIIRHGQIVLITTTFVQEVGVTHELAEKDIVYELLWV